MPKITLRIQIPFVFTKIKWAYQEGAMWRRFREWAEMKIAWLLPRRIALWAFVRVYACDGEAPGEDYSRVYRAWVLGAGKCLLLVLLAAPAVAQELPPPAARYELGIFRSAVSLTTPFSTTVYPLSLITCGQLPVEAAPEAAPNPLFAEFDDPADPTKVCRLSIKTPVLALPIDVKYSLALRAVAVVGDTITGATKELFSAWAFHQFTFRRAPRGVPCPDGPGTLFNTEGDINGKPVQLAVCIRGVSP